MRHSKFLQILHEESNIAQIRVRYLQELKEKLGYLCLPRYSELF